MIWVTTYKVKPYIPREESREMMATFAQNGPGPGTQAHYVAADGSHGVVISDTDDLAAVHRNLLDYGQWIQFDASAMLTVDEAVTNIMDALA